MKSKENTKTKTQELPFTLEGKTAARTFIRSQSSIKESDGLYRIDFNIIRIRPDFNPRQKPKGMLDKLWEQVLLIGDLANGIYENNGPIDPLLGDIFADDGFFYITEGERRFRAIRMLLDSGKDTYPNGEPVNIVKVMLLPRGTTDLDRKRIALRSADKMKLTAMQRARYYLTFSENDDMSHEDIAAFMGVSRQTVDNYIMAATELPLEVQQALDEERVTITAALTAHRESKKKSKSPGGEVDDEDLYVDEHGEVKEKETRKKEEDHTGDTDLDEKQSDNSITFPGSMGGFKEEGSGSVIMGTNAIYMQDKKKALWKQMIHRYENQKDAIISGDAHMIIDDKWIDELAVRLGNEYNLTVK